MSAADYVKPVAVPNFKAAWDALPADTEREDDYGLGAKDGLQVRGGRGGGDGGWGKGGSRAGAPQREVGVVTVSGARSDTCASVWLH